MLHSFAFGFRVILISVGIIVETVIYFFNEFHDLEEGIFGARLCVLVAVDDRVLVEYESVLSVEKLIVELKAQLWIRGNILPFGENHVH